MGRFWQKIYIIAIGVVLGAGAVLARPNLPISAQTPNLRLGVPAYGNIAEGVASQEWQITVTDGQRITFLVNQLSGDLDPTITILNAEGDIIGENDDRLPELIYNAGLEDVTFSEAGTYTVRVGRFAGSGDYQLWALPASYGRIWEQVDFAADVTRWDDGRFAYGRDELLILETDPEFSVFIAPDSAIELADFYMQAEFTWESNRGDENATTGFMLRVQDDGTRRPAGYYFLIKPNGTWSFLSREGEDFRVIQADTAHAVLNDERIHLGVWAMNSRFRFYANGEFLGEVVDDTYASGMWGLHIRGALQIARVAVDNFLLTVPTTPMPDFPETLETWRTVQPNDTIAELQTAELIPNDGERVFILTTQSYDIGAVQARHFDLRDVENAQDVLVVSADVYVINGDNAGCGINFRFLDEANYVAVYVDSDGGLGLLHSQDGVLVHNTYDFAPTVDDPLSGNRLRLTVVAIGDVVGLYANGQYFASAYIPPTHGSLGTSLFNYSTTAAACGYENMWIWR